MVLAVSAHRLRHKLTHRFHALKPLPALVAPLGLLRIHAVMEPVVQDPLVMPHPAGHRRATTSSSGARRCRTRRARPVRVAQFVDIHVVGTTVRMDTEGDVEDSVADVEGALLSEKL